ncbi:hypothetical protein QCA50_001748 [Cerrena zonata]|uniref:Amino acid transporter transmembrane domain-containing protein n=1 Tax=Cerrena zonata TaxID=2478898 RepID=A0AAW0GRN3_9APHY
MSLPSTFSFGSYSTSNVRDVINSYRRAQLYLSDSVSAPTSEDEYEDDVERGSIAEDEEGVTTPRPRGDSMDYGTIAGTWDEDLDSRPSRPTPIIAPILDRRQTDQSTATLTPSERYPAHTTIEETPLLHRATSLSFQRPSYTQLNSDTTAPTIPRIRPIVRRGSQISTLSRISETGTSTKGKHLPGGQSTFGQTLFNAIAILLGIGMLSEPLAFAYAGWIGGTLLIISYGFVACYTGKILAHIIIDDPKLRSYSDIGRKAFGPGSGPWISTLFCMELFTVSVALVTLYADSFHAVLPAFSADFYKIVGLAVFIPTVLMPLSVLSYASIVGILSTLFITAVIFIDGFSKKEAPGSLWSPSNTSLGIHSLGELGVAFGLFMAGFSGHAVIPSLVRDMKDSSQFDVMIDYAFLVATSIYGAIGAAGYIMFGDSVSDEFSKDIMKIPEFNPTLNRMALWGLVLAPLSKYALSARPLNITLEMLLGIDSSASAPDDHGLVTKDTVSDSSSEAPSRKIFFRNFAIAIERIMLACVSVGISILVPDFSAMMAFLGAFTSFLLCIIGPISAKMALSRQVKWYDALILTIAIGMASWGTGAAFWSASE